MVLVIIGLFYILQMTGLFQFTIRQAIESEAKFVAVQRLQHYSEVFFFSTFIHSSSLTSLKHSISAVEIGIKEA